MGMTDGNIPIYFVVDGEGSGDDGGGGDDGAGELSEGSGQPGIAFRLAASLAQYSSTVMPALHAKQEAMYAKQQIWPVVRAREAASSAGTARIVSRAVPGQATRPMSAARKLMSVVDESA